MSLTELGSILESLPKPDHPDLIVGLNPADDAGVFRLGPDTALIQTVDFFTPIVDDPYAFGQISAANALSDVYAMGGRPLTCLNVVGFPTRHFGLDVLEKILLGGHKKVEEAGAVIVGGHTIMDDEMKYGLAVTGIAHPDRILTKAGARPGDVLVLTKPIGTGIVSTAIKRGIARAEDVEEVIRIMAHLNRGASEAMLESGAHASTDITGFGLLGHAYEMAAASGVTFEIWADRVPVIPAAYRYYEKGCIPGGTQNNRLYLQKRIQIDPDVGEDLEILLNDAQTSGGLLISIPREKSELLIRKLEGKKCESAAVIGRVLSFHKVNLRVKKQGS